MKSRNQGGTLSWVILGILGILLIIGRNMFKDILYIVFAVGLILYALFSIAGWWMNKDRASSSRFGIIGSILILLFGIWILTHASTFDKIINVIIGLVMILSGLKWLIQGRSFQDKTMTVMSVLCIILGLIVSFSHAATSWVIIAEGVSLIYTAVTGIMAERRFAR